MSVRAWLPGAARRELRTLIDARVRELVPPPPNPDSVTRAAHRKRHLEEYRAYERERLVRRKELRDARAVSATGSAETF